MDDRTIDDELYSIVYEGDLSNELDTRLKSLPDIDKTLSFFYQRDNQQINLLMLAALNGHDEVIRILLSYSSNVKQLVELTGIVYGIDGARVFHTTALWCACDRGHYTLARTLIEVGRASVYHGPRNPLLIDATINERFDTIQFLIENGYADINRTRENDHPKYNSLMISAIRGQTKIVAYLLEKGAKIDYKTRIYNDTALGCAAMHGHLDIVQLLCSAGASTCTKNSGGETPLILAFKNDHLHVVDYLLDLIDNEICIEELEIIACSFIIPTRSISNSQPQYTKMVNLIRKSFKMRETRNIPKIIMGPFAAYNFQQECQTIEEFDKIQYDNNRLYIEALLIRERILLPKKTIALCEPLLIRGEKLIEQSDFENCLILWEHTFHLYQNMNHETSLHRFVWIFCKMLATNVPISPQIFIRICCLTFEPSEQNNKNHSIKNALCLVTIAAMILKHQTLTETERLSIYQWINDLCRQQRRTSCGQTLLHLSVNDQTYRDINYRANEIKQILNFPSLVTTQSLLTYGNRWIDVDAVDTSNGNTALHIIAQSIKTNALPIVKLLIDAGAHADCLNKHNKTPFNCAKDTEIKNILQNHQRPFLLKCLCARYIVEQQLNYQLTWHKGTQLNNFIYLHGCIAKQNNIN
ncbi:unnamed protein product [Rotaria sp. Silwood2]|nr:unnamed protein product [Rotaria sp. Silwood2]CAF3016030.1 unnamed protein product [Rotaria sp. Silwood2]CAF3282272.1 unnamed protein product [Rotaria sp. Silwood2]CAF3372305.1 unnamed protein product [Rotaria sp. Silwood2]CAF4117315.1 unnamed protein product [Rotaria sp. Silwood2]